MDTIKTREEIDDKYKWDLSRIYENYEEWEKDYKKVWDLCDQYKDLEGKVFSSKENLLKFYEVDIEVDRLTNKIQSYAFLNNNVNIGDAKCTKMMQKLSLLFQKINNSIAFFEEEFFKADYNKVKEMFKNDEKLSIHNNYFERKNRNGNHYLDSNSKKILSSFSDALNTGSEVYRILNNTELKFGTVTLEDNKKVEISHANFISLLKNKDRRVREDAFNKYYKTYEEHSSTISTAYIGDINKNIAVAKLEKYNSNIEKSLFSDNISLDVYDNLIKEINNGLPYLYDYYKFKKNVLNLDELHLYDVYVDIIKDKVNKEYTFDEALDLVFEGLKPLGSQYLIDFKGIFDSKLIDIMPNKNKRVGAFSYCTYDTDPYILLNFGGTFDDILTVAHEGGHSMHSYYSNVNNTRDDASYSIFVGEIASTVNELLVTYSLLDKSDDPKERLYIMNKLLDNYKSIIYRQTMFAEFEKEIYNKKENGETLTKEDICNCYYQLNKNYFGDEVVCDEQIKYEWQRIHHFFKPFYVYKYATSMSASIVIANRIYNGDVEFRDRYLNFLKLGGSMWPLDEIKTLGIEMEDGKIFKEAMESFNNLREKFEKQYNEVYGRNNKVYIKK